MEIGGGGQPQPERLFVVQRLAMAESDRRRQQQQPKAFACPTDRRRHSRRRRPHGLIPLRQRDGRQGTAPSSSPFPASLYNRRLASLGMSFVVPKQQQQRRRITAQQNGLAIRRKSGADHCNSGLWTLPLLVFLLWLVLLAAMAVALLFFYGKAAKEGQQTAAELVCLGDQEDETAKRRLRRQTLPADNVRVYAINSNVSVTDRVQVLSAQSRIQLLERHLNATIWSNGSLLQMAPNGQEVALSASQAIGLGMALSGGARVQATGDSLQLNESSRLAEDGQQQPWARMEAELAGRRVNLSWSDSASQLALRALDAQMATLVSLGWTRPEQRTELSVLSAPGREGGGSPAAERELSIAANSPDYQVQIRLIGAQTSLQFRDARLEIPPNHRSLILRSQGWLLRVQSLDSPFEVHASAKELRIRCYQEALTLLVGVDAIGLEVGQLSRLVVNRHSLPNGTSSQSSTPPRQLRINGGQISSGGDSTDLAELLSRDLRLSLSRDRQLGLALLADARHSQLRLAHANRTSATLTAVRHFVELLGGQPSLELLAGNVSVQMLGQLTEEATPLDTEDILPRELLEAAGDEDPFGIGPIASPSTAAPASHSSAAPTQFPPIVRPATTSSVGSSTTMPTASSPSSPTSSIAPSALPVGDQPITPRMEPPGQLFTFRQSFPSSTPSIVASGTPPVVADDFPSPEPALFTFPPPSSTEGTPDAEFLVGQFETMAAAQQQEQQMPITATISQLQMPANEQELLEDFPGIRRESRLFWSPEEAKESETTPEMAETEMAESELPAEQRRPRHAEKPASNADGTAATIKTATIPCQSTAQNMPPSTSPTSMELLLDVALGEDENLHLERLGQQLRQGMERLLNEEEDSQHEQPAVGERRRRDGQFRLGQPRVEPLLLNSGQLQQKGGGAVRFHFLLEGPEEEGHRVLQRLADNGINRMAQELGQHLQLLSAPRLQQTVSSPPPPRPLPIASPRSPALAAISAYSLPVLPLGLLLLGLCLLAALTALPTAAKAVQNIRHWMLRMVGSEERRPEMAEKATDQCSPTGGLLLALVNSIVERKTALIE